MNSSNATLLEIASIRSKYLRWSVPSLVLAVVASLFALASYRVQRQMTSRYESVVTEYLEAAWDARRDWTLHSMRRAELAAKRLVIEEPQSSKRLLQAAQVDLVSYDRLIAGIARSSEGDRAPLDTNEQWNEIAAQVKGRAIQCMERAARIDDAHGLEARLWIQDWRFRSMHERITVSDERLQDAIRQCEGLLLQRVPVQRLLSDMHVASALRFPNARPWKDITTQIERAKDVLDRDPMGSFGKNASRVEIMTVLDPAIARAEAVAWISESMREPGAQARNWQDREALFRLRLNLGSPQEAFDFAWSNLAELPNIERDIFRWNVASSALRAMVVQLHRDVPAAKRNAALFFGFALRFAPDSPQVVQAIDSLVQGKSGRSQDDWAEIVDAGHDHLITEWLAWLRSCAVVDLEAAQGQLAPLEVERDLVSATMVAFRLLKHRGLLDQQAQLRVLDALIASDHTNADLRRMRDELAAALREPLGSGEVPTSLRKGEALEQ